MANRRDAAAWLILIVLALAACRALAAVVLPVYDDAFITFRYARNLAEGHGLVFQPGERVLGTSSPAWALLLGAVHLMRLPVPGTAIAINIAADAAILLLALLCLPREDRPRAALVLGSLFSLSPLMSRISVGAMEMELFVLCSMAAVWLHVRSRRVAAIVVASLSCAVRLEGALLTLLLLALHWRASSWRRSAGATLAVAVAWGALAAALWSYYGEVIPHSVQAKWQWPRSGVPAVLSGFGAGDPVILLALAPALYAITVSRRRDEFLRLLALWAMAYVSAFLLAGPKIWSWYAAPPCWAVLVLGSMGLLDLAARAHRLAAWLDRPAFRAGLPALALAAWAIVLGVKGPSPVTTRVYRPLERWCAQNGRTGALIGARDIGAIGYHCGARIADFTGLVDRDALRHATVESFVLARRPDYLLVNTTTSYMTIMRRPDLAGLFEPIARFSADGSGSLDLDVGVSGNYVPSYLLFARVKATPS